MPVNTVESQKFRGPVKVRESMVLEELMVPIMVKSDTDADFELRLENRTSRGGWINFTYSKSNIYTELEYAADVTLTRALEGRQEF